MITIEFVYIFAGLVFAAFAVSSYFERASPKRLPNATFYILLAASFLFGSKLSDFGNGLLALSLILVGGAWGIGRGSVNLASESERERRAARHGSLLFVPALLVPAIAFAGTTIFKNLRLSRTTVVNPQAATLVWLYVGLFAGMTVTMLVFRPPRTAPITEGRRLVDTVGWALLLPQMLAALGAVFAVSGVGTAVGRVITSYLPAPTPHAAVIAFAIGMAGFTIIMGNAYAAFPVMMAAIGLPLIVQKFGGNVVVVSAVGMLTGFCGTLVTPMAANFNLVPAALLELNNPYAVIRAQAPTAALLFLSNLVLLWFAVYR
jgi:uncharacterized membrane protein